MKLKLITFKKLKLFGELFRKENLSKHEGFTLLELLIVIGIIAILSVALVIVLNPAEALKKARDSQRMSDLATIKKAIGIYVTTAPSPKMAGTDNVGCKGTISDDTTWQLDTDHIYYSYPSDSPGGSISSKNLDGVIFTGSGGASQVEKANLNLTTGAGWLPINFSSLAGDSPISNVPVDPINTIATLSRPTNTDLVYRYACSEKDLTYEIDATLESDAYTITDNKMFKDGGDNGSYYETGTNLKIMASESPFACGTSTVTSEVDGLVYGTVVGDDTLCWLDRNLGATRVATSFDDTQAYGHLYQWGRYTDGHQITNSGTTLTLSSSDSPGHGNFIRDGNVSPYDWRSPQNDNLWQGVSGTNNPCPSGFRIPTQPEFSNLFIAEGIGNAAAAYASTLKLTEAGNRNHTTAALGYLGGSGFYWTSSVSGTNAYSITFNSSGINRSGSSNRAYGLSVRCIKN